MRSLSERLWQIVLGPIFGKFFFGFIAKILSKDRAKGKDNHFGVLIFWNFL